MTHASGLDWENGDVTTFDIERKEYDPENKTVFIQLSNMENVSHVHFLLTKGGKTDKSSFTAEASPDKQSWRTLTFEGTDGPESGLPFISPALEDVTEAEQLAVEKLTLECKRLMEAFVSQAEHSTQEAIAALRSKTIEFGACMQLSRQMLDKNLACFHNLPLAAEFVSQSIKYETADSEVLSSFDAAHGELLECLLGRQRVSEAKAEAEVRARERWMKCHRDVAKGLAAQTISSTLLPIFLRNHRFADLDVHMAAEIKLIVSVLGPEAENVASDRWVEAENVASDRWVDVLSVALGLDDSLSQALRIAGQCPETHHKIMQHAFQANGSLDQRRGEVTKVMAEFMQKWVAMRDFVPSRLRQALVARCDVDEAAAVRMSSAVTSAVSRVLQEKTISAFKQYKIDVRKHSWWGGERLKLTKVELMVGGQRMQISGAECKTDAQNISSILDWNASQPIEIDSPIQLSFTEPVPVMAVRLTAHERAGISFDVAARNDEEAQWVPITKHKGSSWCPLHASNVAPVCDSGWTAFRFRALKLRKAKLAEVHSTEIAEFEVQVKGRTTMSDSALA